MVNVTMTTNVMETLQRIFNIYRIMSVVNAETDMDKSLILVTISPRHKGHSLSGPEHVEQVQTCPHLKNITSD
jgi:hypothetical protein